MRQISSHTTQRNAFVLVGFIFSIVIVSLITIALAKLTLALYKQHIVRSAAANTQLALANTADSIRAYMEQESHFTFVDSTLQLHTHTIALRDSNMFLDSTLLAQDITYFFIKPLAHHAFSIHLCGRFASKHICINRVGWSK